MCTVFGRILRENDFMDLTFGHELNTEQIQQLSLTPEMVQSLKILRLGGEGLLEYIFEALDENPVLDVNEEDLADRQLVAAVEHDSAGETEPSDDFSDYSDGSIEELEYGSDWYSYYYDDIGRYDGDARYTDYSYDSEYRDLYEYESGSEESLTEHLNAQLEMTEAPFLVKAVADYIIQTLDDNGYMTLTVSEIGKELSVSRKTVEEGLVLVQSFDPAGVACADLSECLALQLKSIGKWDGSYEYILDHHTEDIARNRLHRIARAMGLKLSEIQRRADVLRSLEPKPGNGFSAPEKLRYIIPDVKVKKTEDGYRVFINRASSPRLSVREEYCEMMKGEGDSDVRSFLAGHMNSADWLIKALRQRDETILKVTEEIVRCQEDFFESGPAALKPLTMKEVAASVGVHESTVSRTVNDKYLLCARGVYELRYFFTGSASFGDSGTTAESVKVMISRMVDSENRAEPMSDRSIAEAIHITGVKISRRTVAKYREELGIPASSIRRRAE